MTRRYGRLLHMIAAMCVPVPCPRSRAQGPNRAIRQVLLLSIDGMHALDLTKFILDEPDSTLAGLAGSGSLYTNASGSQPSDAFPGMLSIVTGGPPRITGVFYDDSYDRSLYAPGSKIGAGATPGTEVAFTASIDMNPAAADGGGMIDPAKLPLDAKGRPVYPHGYLRVNTAFEVARAAGLRTAWCDKHLAFEIVNGPSGKGVDDLYTPEIAANDVTASLAKTEAYDDGKIQAVINQINGKDHAGKPASGVPALFGMDFQAVNVAQRLPDGGYAEAEGEPSAMLSDALAHTDRSMGRIVAELRSRSLLASTLIVITARHGQAPTNVKRLKIIDDGVFDALVNSVEKGLLAHVTADNAALIWLSDPGETEDVAEKLADNSEAIGAQEILSGERIKLLFDDPLKDSRTPDIVVLPVLGTIYAAVDSKLIAAHGGFQDEDIHAPILVSNPALKAAAVKSPIQTTQIAPTILQALGLNPQDLDAVRMEQTPILPGLASVIGNSVNACDVSGDGKLTVADVTLLLRKALGL